ncbi:MAG: PAS domain S-box protein [candidate division Zixibacteria bacterium]|nr:PAS domain S-box protein [candidate division Zixibacteria bacterium]
MTAHRRQRAQYHGDRARRGGPERFGSSSGGVDYGSAFEAAPGALVLIGPDGTITGVNADVETLFGYTRRELAGRPFNMLVAGEFDDSCLSGSITARAVPAGGHEPRVLFLMGRRKDGTEFPVQVRLNRTSAESGGCIVLLIQDGDQKTLDQEMARKVVELQSMLEAFPDLYFRLDSDGTFISYSTRAVSELYVSPDEFLGRKVYEVMPKSIADRYHTAMAAIRRTNKVYHLEYTLSLPGGDQTYEARVLPLPDSQFLVVARNITARKQAEEALKRSEEKYRQLYENLQDGSGAVDKAGNIVESNAGFQRMLGYTSVELLKMTYRDITPAKWHAMELKILEEQVIPRGYSDIYEKEYIRKDGTTFPVEVRTYLVRNANGEPQGMFAFTRDISERKSTADELHRAYDRIRAEMEVAKDRNIALKEILNRLESERSEFKRQIVANVEKVLLPTLLKLKDVDDVDIRDHVVLLEKSLQEITSPFVDAASSIFSHLSPREMEICQMIRNRLSSKEIASILGISPATIHKHREMIRRKLKLQHKDINLNSYLRNL